MSYSEEWKKAVLKKMLAPRSHSIPEMARAEENSEATCMAGEEPYEQRVD